MQKEQLSIKPESYLEKLSFQPKGVFRKLAELISSSLVKGTQTQQRSIPIPPIKGSRKRMCMKSRLRKLEQTNTIGLFALSLDA